MDFSCIEEYNDRIIIKDVRNFQLNHIFECGQCFRWNKSESGTYIGVALGKVIEVGKVDNDVIIYNTNKEEFVNLWANYFDFYRDYGEVKNILSKDELLRKAVEYGEGIRLLKQDPFEIIVSFIISANNRIPMIKKAIDKICVKWGKPVEYKNHTYYTFPTLENLSNATIEEFEECGTGFRAKYIKDTIERIKETNNLKEIISLNDDECHKKLQEFSGIGPKVADCIMLFSMEKYSAFPVDVWVKRAMQHFYLAPDVSLKKIRNFGREKFGVLSGFAQQYFFYYARENRILD